jgi:hypothetical protein
MKSHRTVQQFGSAGIYRIREKKRGKPAGLPRFCGRAIDDYDE